MIWSSLFNATTNTNGYYIAGYAVFFIIMAIYLASMIIRSQNLKKEYKLLVMLEEE